MLSRSVVVILLMHLTIVAPASCGDAVSPEKFQAIEDLLANDRTKEVRALGDKAIPALADLFKRGKHRPEILPIVANSKTNLARTTIERFLRAEDDNNWIYWEARALGLLKNPDSKPVL